MGDGTIPVKCWVAGQKPALQGKIYSVYVDITIEDIKNNIDVLEGIPTNIIHVAKGKDNSGQLTMTVYLDFDGIVPRRVSLQNVSYRVQQVRQPPKRCFKCFLFDHSTLTCTFRGTRCTNCCEVHPDPDSCPKPLKCLFCNGPHKYTDKICEYNKKAEDIENKKNWGGGGGDS